jgi:hypothetical protein
VKDRYGLEFEDDGASFRLRRLRYLGHRFGPAPPSFSVKMARALIWLCAICLGLFLLAVAAALIEVAIAKAHAMDESVCEESGAYVVMPIWNFRHFDAGASEDAAALMLFTVREHQALGRSIALETRGQLEALPPFRWAWEHVLAYRSPMAAEMAYIPWCRKQ